MEMAMNGRSTLCYSVVVDLGEAPPGFEDFLEMFGARHSPGDLFDLVRQGGGGGATGGGSSMEVQPARLRLSSSLPAAVTLPPSEDDMAAWLYQIVSGQEPAVVAGHDDQPSAVDVGHSVVDNASADDKRERPPNMEEKCCHSGAEDSAESRKKATRGARRSHPAETRNLAHKKRRCKINEKLKTLQRLVPGCDDKSSQASTLDQTIRHIKSLQQQILVQSLAHTATGCYPVMPPPPPPPYLPPGAAVVAAAGGLLPAPTAALLPPAVLAMAARGHVRPEVVLAPPRSGDGPFISSSGRGHGHG